MFDIFFDHTFQVVAWGAGLMGFTAGILGAFAVLRQQSLMGDAVAHATLPGVVAAFWLTQIKHPLVLLLGAAIAGWIGMLLFRLIIRHTRLKSDAGLGLVLSVFFGAGLMLLTMVQHMPTASKAGLHKFLFGSASTLLWQDISVLLSLSGIVLGLVFLFWKELKLVTFDEDYAKTLGLPVKRIDIFLTVLIVTAIVIGLQSVGVVLMSAMLVAPAAAARQWTDRLEVMALLAGVMGAFSGILGTFFSSAQEHLPTGPVIVLVMCSIVLVSLFFAPQRGLMWDLVRRWQGQRNIRAAAMLKNLLLFSEIQTNPFHPHDIQALKAIGLASLNKTMKDLERRGYVTQLKDRRWALTPQGLKRAHELEAGEREAS